MSGTAILENLLALVARQDVGAFRMICDETCDQLMAVAQRICRDRAMAEDVLQEVDTRIWQRTDRFDPERCTALARMTVIARNRAIDHVRRPGRPGDAGREAAASRSRRSPRWLPGPSGWANCATLPPTCSGLPCVRARRCCWPTATV